ncbi:MAG TPA: aspartate-semialdehyde dehydrogenase [Kiritimatiellia bacterium]|nr:aspartate-semialdehyde dehydrogenase [Kiritimatiellia bacterium]HNR94388.1 aspartate-semialdehyde dehydrogenase [Kiritimatiellia bacterium]HPA77325.1 aspartate-semialdehyde dehydrogenase [Kiritimatiellia bacterium]HQQ04360.1 aspartate-semialdehyde dehydrogenase [Kiritimatiellia bacterium]
MKKYNVCVVGAGAVGEEMVKMIQRHKFPVKKLTVLARSARRQKIGGRVYDVKETTMDAFNGMDIAFFAGTEGEKGASQVYGWEAVKRGCVVIDNGDDFRMDKRVPLVIPEVNPQALKKHKGLIANPNCSTIIALMALAPIQKAAGIKRMVVCTYQAVSGSGAAAVRELEDQVRAWAAGKKMKASVYPHPIAFNVLAQIGSVKDIPGVTTEEAKLRRETHKILGDPSIRVSTTCVRVPVFNGHSEAIHLELKKPLSVAKARQVLAKGEGLKVVDDMEKSVYPMPTVASGSEITYVGRIRKDDSVKNGLALFVSGDNLWKGAAQNAIQIAEKMIEMKLI